jgi:hypothetical protein
MELFQHTGFQTVEFGLLLVWAGWILLGFHLSWRFVATWCFLGFAGLIGLRFWGADFPILPFFVSFGRIIATLSAAALTGEYFDEWRQHRGHSVAHLLGVGLALAGLVMAWWDNWEVSAATLLVGSFLCLGYCARVNRTS